MSRPRSIDDEALLPKLTELFWRNGYAKTGIRELEQASGLKAPSLYNRFGSKEALFQAALAYYLRVVVCQRIERYLQADDPLLGLRAFFDSTYDYMREGKPPMSCLLVNASLELNSSDDAATRAQLVEGNRMIRAAFRATLKRAQKRGLLRADADMTSLADCLHLGLQGLLVSSKVEPNKNELRKRTDALFSLLPLTSTKDRKD